MTNRTCLTCKYWNRHADVKVGTCKATNMSAICSFRGEQEICTEGMYQQGPDRLASPIEGADRWWRKVCADYVVELPVMDVTR